MAVGSVNIQGLEALAQTEEGLIAHLTFDEEVNGSFDAGNAEVEVRSKGENVLEETSFASYAGKALYLDGTGSNYLSLKKMDGSGLIAGKDQVTISYWSKVTSESGRANWGFMIVDEGKEIPSRQYIAALDKATSVSLERFNGTGTQATGQSYTQNTWKLVTAVFTPDSTQLYINGKPVSTKTGTSLTSFLDNAERFYIGGAENGWPNEYFTGYIDEFKVYDYAMDQEQAKTLYDSYILKDLTMTEEDLQELAEGIFHYKDNEVRGNITLPQTLSYGGIEDIIDVTWTTSDPSVIFVEPRETDSRTIPAGKVNRPEAGEADKIVTLTAVLHCGTYNVSTKKEYTLTVKAMPQQKEYKNYAYSYFQVNPYGTGESQNIHLAVSQDGLKWRELNNADPILKASDLRKPDGSKGEGGVRDSYLLRSPEGDHFYLIGTDLDVFDGKGWGEYGGNGSRYIAVWESDDLVNWYNGRLVPLAREDHSCMWAPEATWDPVSEQYLVYWSSGLKDGETGKHIWCGYTRDFYTFSEPQIYKGVLKPDTSSSEALVASRGYYFKKTMETNTDNGVPFGQPNWRFEKIYVSEPEEKILDVNGNDVDLSKMQLPQGAYTWQQLAAMEERQRLNHMTAYDAIPEQITYLDTSMLFYNGTYYRLTKRENDVTVMLEYSDDIQGPWTLADTIIADQFGVEGPAIYAIEDEEDRKAVADALRLEETPEVVFQIYLDGYGNYHAGYYPLIATSEEALRNGDLQAMPDNSYQLPIGAKHGSFVPITDEEYQALVDAYGVVDHKEKTEEVVYYDMETDEDGNLVDQSQGGNKGSFGVKENAPSGSGAAVVEKEEEDGSVDRVLKFDGNGYVKLPTNLLVDEQDLTISMWVKNTEETPGASAAFYFGMKAPQQYCMLKTKNNMTVNYTNDTWIYYDENGKEVVDHKGKEDTLFARNHYDGYHNQIEAKKEGTENDWGLYTIMIDAESAQAGEGAVVRIYYNGELADTRIAEQKPTDFGIALVSYLGKSAYNDPYFIGEMKEFKIYDRLWTDDEIKAEYAKLAEYRDTHQEIVDPPKRKDEENSAIASFSFDSYDEARKAFVDEKTGAAAYGTGTIQTSDTEKVSGKALFLDGASYLSVKDVDGRSLLAGYDEVTISYLSKVTKTTGPNWGFIAQQTGSDVTARNYIGMIEFADFVRAERADGKRASIVLDKGNLNTGEWHLVTAVFKEGSTELYVDNEMVSADAPAKLSEFFEGSSTFQIGKADWGGGEYFNGYLDEFKVYNYALSAKEVEARYQSTLGGGQTDPDQERADEVIDKINAIGTVEYSDTSKARIEAARKAYDALSEAQKANVSNYEILTKAEGEYADLKEKAEQEEASQRAVKAVMDVIDAIGTVEYTDVSNARIEAARKAYDALSAEQKKLVTNYGKLTAAETRYALLKEEAEKKSTNPVPVKKGQVYKVGNYKYRVTNARMDGKGTVTLTGVTRKNLKKIKAANTIKLQGRSFQVTQIGKSAFKGCKKATSAVIGKNVKVIGSKAFYQCSKLKKITIKGTAIKKVGKNVLKGINDRAKIKVPAKKLKAYKKLLNKKGQKKSVKIMK